MRLASHLQETIEIQELRRLWDSALVRDIAPDSLLLVLLRERGYGRLRLAITRTQASMRQCRGALTPTALRRLLVHFVRAK